MSRSCMGEQITALWQEAVERLRTFGELARRTVEAAWLGGDALPLFKKQLPHGAWTSALKERGISRSTAHRFIQLRQKYPEMSQFGTFRNVQAALADGKKSSEGERATPTTRQHNPAYLVSADDLSLFRERKALAFWLACRSCPHACRTNITGGTNSAPCHGTISSLDTRLRSRIS